MGTCPWADARNLDLALEVDRIVRSWRLAGPSHPPSVVTSVLCASLIIATVCSAGSYGSQLTILPD